MKYNFFSNAFSGTFLTSTTIRALGIAQGVILSRMLGATGRGEYAAIILWPTFFAMVGLCGTNFVIIRHTAKHDKSDELFRSALLLSLITSFFTTISCYFLIPLLLKGQSNQIILLSQVFTIFIIINHFGVNLISVHQGRGNFKKFNINRLILNPVYLIFLFCLWITGYANLQTTVFSLLLANFIALSVRFFGLIKVHSLFGKIYSLKKLLKESISFGIAGIFMPLYMQADKMLLLWLLDVKALGLYTVALSAAGVASSVTDAAGLVVLSKNAKYKHKCGGRSVAKVFRITVIIWFILGVILASIMPFILPFIYGNSFENAVVPAQLLVLGAAMGGLANLLEQAIRGQGKAFIGLFGRISGLCLMGASGVILSSYWALSGICVAYILGQSCCLFVLIWRVKLHYSRLYLSMFIPRIKDFSKFIRLIESKLKIKA